MKSPSAKLHTVMDFSERDYSVLDQVSRTSVSFARGELIATAGKEVDHIFLVKAGWVSRSRTLSDGRRQIIGYHLPGDFISIDSYLFKSATRDWHAVTRVDAIAFAPRELIDRLAGSPGLVPVLMWHYTRQLSLLGEHLISVGRRTAAERTGHLLLEFWYRLRELHLADDNGYALPLTQEMLADTLGLSPVYISRTLRLLRKQGLIDVRDGFPHRVEILDSTAAVLFTGFDLGDLRMDKNELAYV